MTDDITWNGKWGGQPTQSDALREALERIANLKWDTMTQGCNAACEASKIARTALEQSK